MKQIEIRQERLFHPRIYELKQHDQLRAAEIIPNEDLTDRRILSGLFHMGQTVCFSRGFDALAFTQLKDETFVHFGFSHNYTNVIYLGHEHSGPYHDMLVLNPQVISKPGTPLMAVVESCGSIDDCKSSMVVLRPQTVYFSGIAYHPRTGNIPIENAKAEWITAALLDHEYVHIQGKSALSEPEKICDITEYKDKWVPISGLYRREESSVEDHIHYVANEKRKNFLIMRGAKKVYLSPETVLKLYPKRIEKKRKA